MKADVVLASYEALVSDVSMLKSIAWEAVLVDERDRVPSALAKAYQAASELETPCRLVLQNIAPEQAWPGSLCMGSVESVACCTCCCWKPPQLLG